MWDEAAVDLFPLKYSPLGRILILMDPWNPIGWVPYRPDISWKKRAAAAHKRQKPIRGT